MQTSSVAEEPSGTIVAGTGNQEKTFYAPQSALEKSTVIRGWIEDKDSIPTSLQKGDALYFPECDPEVVYATIEYLKSTKDGLIAIMNPSAKGGKDVLFYMKLYKFALCLGVNELCDLSLHKIKELTRDTEAFLHVLTVSTEEKTSLVDDRQFHSWMMGYVIQKSAVLRESTLFKTAIMQNSELAWRLCSLLISSLGGTGNGTEAHHVPSSMSLPNCAPLTKSSSSENTPEIKRRSGQYSYQPQKKSPSPGQDINRIKKSKKYGVKKFSATVEDAVDEEYLTSTHEPDI